MQVVSPLAVTVVLCSAMLTVRAQDEWVAPPDVVAKKNPVAASDESIRLGRATYLETCASCHGKTGRGDGFAAGVLKSRPKDLATVLAKQLDGEVFWKIRTGNELMPSSELTEEGTWHVVNFIRTLRAKREATHPWASFPKGAWVDVHTEHKLVTTEGTEPTEWSSDSRMSVSTITANAITIEHENSARNISEKASVVVPAVDDLPGVRALGQWPHDIFPYGPQRESGVTPEDKQPRPVGVQTKTVRAEEITFDGKPRGAMVITREWAASVRDATQRYLMTAWVVDGIELPVRWTLAVDGKLLSESELVGLSQPVKVGKTTISCAVTVTKKHVPEGTIVKRRWSSTQVPGFLVKMESRMVTDEYSLDVREWVTDFRATAPQDVAEDVNPPGSRPALGIMPDYGAEYGILVDGVRGGGPAAKAGIIPGDLIIEIGGKETPGIQEYMDVMSTLRIGKKVSVKIERAGKDRELTIVVGERRR